MHITSFLYDTDPDRLAAFEAEARKHFELVRQVRRTGHGPAGGVAGGCAHCASGNDEHPDVSQCEWMGTSRPPCTRVLAFAFYSRDSGYDDLIYTLPQAAEALSGILEYDIEIVSAWQEVGSETQRLWPVPGRPESDGDCPDVV